MRAFHIFGLALVLSAPALAQAPAIDPALGDVTVTAQVPAGGAYVGEMILVTMRSTIRAQITLHEIHQPQLLNFDWQQFGNDRAIETMVNGFRVAGIERSLAVFPRKAGHLVIEPFVRHVTVMTADGARVEGDFASAPLTIDVRAHDGVEPAGSWWLPAKSVRIIDSFEQPPDHLGLNDSAHRTLVIEAAGITADRLPPAPVLRAAGLISFVGPAERTTLVTPDGPVARAVYHWNMRPVSDAPAEVPAIHIPWFDTATRKMRDAAVPAQRISFLNPIGEGEAQATVSASTAWHSWPGLAALMAGIVWGAAAMVGVAGWRPHRQPPPIRALRRAAHARNALAFRAAMIDLQRLDVQRWRSICAVPAVAVALMQLDAALFGKSPKAPPPLVPLARTISSHWRSGRARRTAENKALRSVDG